MGKADLLDDLVDASLSIWPSLPRRSSRAVILKPSPTIFSTVRRGSRLEWGPGRQSACAPEGLQAVLGQMVDTYPLCDDLDNVIQDQVSLSNVRCVDANERMLSDLSSRSFWHRWDLAGSRISH